MAVKSRGSIAIVFAYFGALVCCFLGERVFATIAGARWALTGIGFFGVFGLTTLRWSVTRALGSARERRAAERALAILSTIGCVALLVYATTVEPFDAKLGITDLATQTRQRWQAAATILWVALLLGSTLPMAFAELALLPMRGAASVVEWRRVRDAMLAGLTLGLAAVYGGLFTFVADMLEVKADFSYFHTARPSESTRKIAASASGPISVTAFFPQPNDVGSEAAMYLRDLAASAPNVEVHVYDRLLMPQMAKDAKVTEDGVIVIEHKLQRESVSIGTEIQPARPKLKTLDADFQKALLKVMREKRTAYFTVGHGELNDTAPSAQNEGRTGKGVRQLLEQQNYAARDLSATSGLGMEVPADATLVVVLGPQQGFRPEEIASLERYADRGGRLFLALDPDPKGEIGSIADVAGLGLSKASLANDKVHMRRRYNDSDRVILATNRFSSHASVSTLSRLASRPVYFLAAGALEKKSGDAGLKIDFAVRAMPETFNDENGNFAFDSATEKRNTYALVAAVSKAIMADDYGAKKRSDEMRAFVIADGDAASDAVLGNDGNVLLVADGLRWLNGEESFAGTLTTTEDVKIEHTKQKDLVWFYGTIFGAPAIVLVGGLLYTRGARRKKKGAAPKRGEPLASASDDPRDGSDGDGAREGSDRGDSAGEDSATSASASASGLDASAASSSHAGSSAHAHEDDR
jgi:hypothetical protein